MKEPKVSILMPVYKGDEFLQYAVDSILNQTLKDFEFIIICDDPTNETRSLFDRYQQKDSRMRVIYQKRQGLVKSLNTGISLAKGEYIARMDADDISLPDRLRKQVEFMDNNREIGISGTWIKIFGDVPEFVLKHPCDNGTIKSSMLFFCAIAHPSVIIRKDVFCKNGLCYNQNETYAEDYGLWIRAFDSVKIANIPQIHLCYRIHSSNTNRKAQEEVSSNIRLLQIHKLGINPTKEEVRIHESICHNDYEINKHFILLVKSWFEKLQEANNKLNIYSEPAFSTVLGNYWLSTCFNSKYLSLNSWRFFQYSKLNEYANFPYRKKLIFFLKCSVKSFKSGFYKTFLKKKEIRTF